MNISVSPRNSLPIECRWVAHYCGPNPLAPSALVVAEVSSDHIILLEDAKTACDHLWLWSGMKPASALGKLSTSDALLLIGHVSTQWALAALNEVRGLLVHAGARRSGLAVQVWLEFHNAAISRAALQLALSFLNQSIMGTSDHAALDSSLKSLLSACRQQHPDYQSRLLMLAAKQAGIPFMPFLEGHREWQFGWGAKSRVFHETATNADGALGWRWQRNKVTSKLLMSSMGFPVPAHMLVSSENDLPRAIDQVGMPCVIKPLDRGGGRGVTANISDMEALRLAFHHARRFSDGPLLLEQHVKGVDYRLLVVNGQLVAAIQREASYLLGDGRSTVEELLAKLNATRSHNLTRSSYLKPIAIDAVLLQHLRIQGADFKSVLPLDEKLTLRSNANLSTGGVCLDVTYRLHPELRAMVEQLALVTGLWAVGFDYLTSDIGKSPWESGGRFIEINATPGMGMFVAAGWEEADIGRVLLGENLGPIPVTLTVVAQAHIASQLQALNAQHWLPYQGWVCGNQVRIGAAGFSVKVQRPWDAVQAALRNRSLKELSVVCTGADIVRHGLPVEHLDRASIQDDTLPEAWKGWLRSVGRQN